MAKKNVIIEVDGNPMILKLGFNGLVELEEVLGKPVTEMANGEIKFSDLRTIFWIALKYGSKNEITLIETGDILDEIMGDKGINYLTEKLTELFNNIMGAQEQESFLHTVK